MQVSGLKHMQTCGLAAAFGSVFARLVLVSRRAKTVMRVVNFTVDPEEEVGCELM